MCTGTSVDYLVGRVPVVWKERDADARRDFELEAFVEKRPRDDLEELAGERERLLLALDAVERHEELVAAVPPHDAAPADRLVQACRRLAQQQVAGRVREESLIALKRSRSRKRTATALRAV